MNFLDSYEPEIHSGQFLLNIKETGQNEFQVHMNLGNI